MVTPRTRAKAADHSARMCAIWAEASQRRLRRVLELEPRRGQSLPLETQNELLGEAFLAIVALDEALTWARWLCGNRDDALENLGQHTLDGMPVSQADLDMMWAAIRARRDAIAHLEKEASANPLGHIVIERDAIVITGYPPLGVTGCRLWSTLLADWSERILKGPSRDDQRPEQRPPWVDGSDWPRWLQLRKSRRQPSDDP
jgi:hypothetical protein